MALNQTGVNIEALMYNTMKVAEGYSPEPLLGWVAEVAKGAPNGRLAALVTRLDRMAAQIGRVEDAVAESVGEAMAPTS